MAREYGGYAYVEKFHNRKTPVFMVAAVPHVRQVFKRLFPGHRQNPDDTSQLVISATLANARDLKWFLDRYPLHPIDDDSRTRLLELAGGHVDGEQALDQIFGGQVPELVGEQELAITPRKYQLVVPAMVRARGFLILGDDLGAGKTLSTSLIFTDPEALPALVVAPTHLVDQWAYEELPKYFPWIRTHILRQRAPYTVAEHRSCRGQEPHVLVSTYGMLTGWADELAGTRRTVIFDEGDELRTGEGTHKHEAALHVARSAKYRILATGTPVHNYGDELWNLVDLLSEGALGTKDEFRHTWGGKKVTDPRALGQFLREEGIMLRRTLEDVGIELPPLSQMIYPIETDHDVLKREMDAILAMAMKVVGDGDRMERWSLSGQLDMKIRKATGVAKAPHVARFTQILLQGTEKVVLVGHHHEVYDIWRRELAEYNPVFYTGEQSKKQKAETKHRFTRGDSRVFVLALQSGSGLNGLQEVCNTMVYGEWGWSPARHKQIGGRIFRPGQKKPVSIFFPMSNGGSDPPMADLIELKRRIAEPITDPDADIVMPSADEAAKRVRQMAEALLRSHGIDPRKAAMPDPVPGSGELISAGTWQQTDPLVAERSRAHAADIEADLALAQLEAPPSRPSREALAGRLVGDRS